MVMIRRLLLFCLLFSALSCKREKKEVLEEVLPTQLSALEEEIFLAGIDSLMPIAAINGRIPSLNEFLIYNTFESFNRFYEAKTSDSLILLFNAVNEELIGEEIIPYFIPDSLFISESFLDSLRKDKSTDFWSGFHEVWFTDKRGLIGLTKPAIIDNRAVFWYSIMTSGKSGGIFIVWMLQTQNQWKIEKVEVRMEF
jgi:hypothetical protein